MAKQNVISIIMRVGTAPRIDPKPKDFDYPFMIESFLAVENQKDIKAKKQQLYQMVDQLAEAMDKMISKKNEPLIL